MNEKADENNIIFIYFFAFIFYCYSIKVVSIFPPLLSPALPTPNLPVSILPASLPIVFVHGSFIQVPWIDPSPSFPCYPPALPSGYCEFVLYFSVSGSLLLTFCFVD